MPSTWYVPLPVEEKKPKKPKITPSEPVEDPNKPFSPPHIPEIPTKVELGEDKFFQNSKENYPVYQYHRKAAYYKFREQARENPRNVLAEDGLYERNYETHQKEVQELRERMDNFKKGSIIDWENKFDDVGPDTITFLEALGILTPEAGFTLLRHYNFDSRYETDVVKMFDSFEYYLKQVTESKLKYIEYLKRHGVEEGKMLPREVVKLLHDRPVMCRLTAFSIQMAPLLNSWHAIFENPITFIAPFQFYVLLSMRNGMKNDDIKAFYQYMKFRGYHILKHPRPPNCFRYPFPMSSLGHNFYVTNDLLFWEFFEGFRGRWEACRKVIANADPHEFQLVWCKTITKARNSISELDNELREMFEKEGYGNKNNNENVDEKVDGNGNAE